MQSMSMSLNIEAVGLYNESEKRREERWTVSSVTGLRKTSIRPFS